MIEIGAVASESTNLTLRSIDALAAADRSYAGIAQKEAAETESASMGFDDFLDMINPLEHIPVLSSLYRAVTGETINPVARIAGDALYSAALGPVSAGLAAIGAIGDEIVTASNGGE
ncbi:MAG: hypothetical protein PHE27_09095, partial [Alphaproteobacteria bacterium]|nr:hypothetical protein [Alphaproteobacteria bacterium]